MDQAPEEDVVDWGKCSVLWLASTFQSRSAADSAASGNSQIGCE